MSVGPGVKPVTPALPLVPNKLKLFALTMLLASFSYFRRDSRLVAGDQAIVEREGSAAVTAKVVVSELRYATAIDWRDCLRWCC